MKVTCRTLIAISVLLAGADSLLGQGSLTPPGTPAPTMKTLEQIEPRIDLQNAPAAAVTTTNAAYHFIITQPGSYYLSANLGVTKTNGIQINTEGVTLDLNGFQIARASGTGGNGIEIAPVAHRTSVRNGSLKGFAIGINSPFGGTGYSRGCAFRDLAVSGCTEGGILAGLGAVLQACRAHDNTGTQAFRAEGGSTLTDCTVYNNTVEYGIFVGGGSTLTNCTAYGNTATYGIRANQGSSLTNCSAEGNTSAASTSAGIHVFADCTVVNCSSYNNQSSAAATHTTGMGFRVGSGSTIQGCTAATNEGDGINIFADTTVRDNNCEGNGFSGTGAGIYSGSGSNRIEANNVAGNDRGIEVGGTGSLIIKNSASGNAPNYVIAVGNSYGAIVDDSGGGGAAVSGSSAVSTFGSPNAWANFSY